MKKILYIFIALVALFALVGCDDALHNAQSFTGTVTITGLPSLEDINSGFGKSFTGLTINGSAGGWANLPNTPYDGSGKVVLELDNYVYPWDMDQVAADCKDAFQPLKIVITDQDGGWFSDDVAYWYGLGKTEFNPTFEWKGWTLSDATTSPDNGDDNAADEVSFKIKTIMFINIPSDFNGKTIGVVEDWVPGNDWATYHSDMTATVADGKATFTFADAVLYDKDKLKIQTTVVKETNEVDWYAKVYDGTITIPVDLSDSKEHTVIVNIGAGTGAVL
jgi:hypothetical protein